VIWCFVVFRMLLLHLGKRAEPLYLPNVSISHFISIPMLVPSPKGSKLTRFVKFHDQHDLRSIICQDARRIRQST